jgi:hypothetical protein
MLQMKWKLGAKKVLKLKIEGLVELCSPAWDNNIWKRFWRRGLYPFYKSKIISHCFTNLLHLYWYLSKAPPKNKTPKLSINQVENIKLATLYLRESWLPVRCFIFWFNASICHFPFHFHIVWNIGGGIFQNLLQNF